MKKETRNIRWHPELDSGFAREPSLMLIKFKSTSHSPQIPEQALNDNNYNKEIKF